MTSNEENFNNNYCSWEMVTGESGTFVRVFDMNFDFTGLIDDVSPELLLDMWYYDNATPISTFGGSQGAPKYPNGFSLCSALLDDQVFIFKDIEIDELLLHRVENFMIFLSLRFYVKSFFQILEVLKMPCLQF